MILALDQAIASLNAIENGMSLVRQADRGMSLAADPYGRVLAQTDYSSTDRTMVTRVPVWHVGIVCTAFGCLPGRLCPAGFLCVVVRALIGHRKTD